VWLSWQTGAPSGAETPSGSRPKRPARGSVQELSRRKVAIRVEQPCPIRGRRSCSLAASRIHSPTRVAHHRRERVEGLVAAGTLGEHDPAADPEAVPPLAKGLRHLIVGPDQQERRVEDLIDRLRRDARTQALAAARRSSVMVTHWIRTFSSKEPKRLPARRRTWAIRSSKPPAPKWESRTPARSGQGRTR
jgi:hypothetical protein